MAIRITEDGTVIYENEPDIDRELFPNIPEGGGSPEQITKAVNQWLEDHPEATTTVMDGSITREKLDSELNSYLDSVDSEFGELKENLKHKTGLSEEAKVALLDCFEHVAWIDEHGQTYYNNLYDALYPESDLVRLEAVFTQGSAVIYPTTPLNDLKAYLVVTGYYNDGTSGSVTDYALSGTLTVGTSTVTAMKDGKTATFDVTVSQPYWDYEWYASSKTAPEGMTADYYDFTTEDNAMFVKVPNIDFDYVGDCIVEVEARPHCEGNDGTVFYIDNNPQIIIKNAVVSENQYRGIKVIFNSNLASNPKYSHIAVGINGVNSLLADRNTNNYHTYKITAQGNIYSLSIDGTTEALTQNTNVTPYIGHTGIEAAHIEHGFYGMFIKSIKFKKL